jgi:FixJ family two-component response regulator
MRKIVGIVDDDPTMPDAVDRLLRAAGYETELFSSGDALLDRLSTSVAACLLIDIHLGSDCGIALGRRLAALGSALPVIFMSGADDQATKRAAIDAGCIAFLNKPFPANLLMEAVERALRRNG